MRAAIYARVSTLRQEQEETIESQLAAVKDKISSDGAVLAEGHVYKDEGYSGSLIERPALDELRENCKQGLFDVVYVFDYGRFSRDLTDLMIIKDDIERSGIQVLSLFERITGDQSTDRLLLQIMGAVHEYEKKKIAQRFHNGKIQKAKRGQIVGYNAPYGYRYNKETGEFEIYEPEAVIVGQIFNWIVTEGCSAYSIIKRLHEAGVKPQKNKSDFWSKGPVDRILKNETYIGHHYYNKSESIEPRYRLSKSKYRRQMKTGRRKRGREEWIPHVVPAIIDEDLFYRAQEQLKRNIKFRPGNRKHDYLLTGLVYCTCSSRRNGDGPEGKKYYRCISRHQYYDRKNRCTVGGLNVTLLDALVWGKTKDLLTNPERIKEFAEKWVEKNTAESDASSTKSAELNHQLARLSDEETRYAEAYGKGIMSLEMFERKMNEITPSKASIRQEMTTLSQNRGRVAKIDVEELAKKAVQKIADFGFEQKKFIVERVIDKIVANPREVTIWGSIPIPAFAGITDGKVKYEPINRNCGIAKCG